MTSERRRLEPPTEAFMASRAMFGIRAVCSRGMDPYVCMRREFGNTVDEEPFPRAWFVVCGIPYDAVLIIRGAYHRRYTKITP